MNRNLTLEYAISAAAVARAWSNNLNLFLAKVGLELPKWFFNIPVDGGEYFKGFSIMSVVICALCTLLLMRGVKESATFNKIITTLNISLILFIIIYGAMFVDPSNWFKSVPDNMAVPKGCHRTVSWFPCGMNGVMLGAATVFFSYVGFDSCSTLAEEVRNPRRDMPIGILGTLFTATTLYIGASSVVTGMVPWYVKFLNVETKISIWFIQNYSLSRVNNLYWCFFICFL